MTDATLFRDDPPLVVGILNMTPDSFSDGGQFATVAAAVAAAERMAAVGAALIDIGGESTRPGHQPVTEGEELARVLPLIEGLAGRLAVPISIDTTKPAVARAALARGAAVVNDQWSFQKTPAMAEVVAEAGAPAILMHNSAEQHPELDIGDEMLRFFERSLHIATQAGIPSARLILDPGIGFGKSPDQQLAALAAIPRLRRAFGCPVLVGVSRKSFLGRITGSAVEARLPETIAANCYAYARGARLFRVHDVAAHVAALAVASALERVGS